MAVFVTLDIAKGHLKLPVVVDDPGDTDLQRKVDAAEGAILAYIGRSTAGAELVATWTAEAPPPADVLAAILLQLGELYRFRGDDPDRDKPWRSDEDGDRDFSPAVLALLRRLGDLVIA